MHSPTKPVLLLIALEAVFLIGIPALAWPLLPAGVRSWLNASQDLWSVIAVIVAVSLLVGILTTSAYLAWKAIARRVFNREYIDGLVAEWSERQ
jgi:hypothetical protein